MVGPKAGDHGKIAGDIARVPVIKAEIPVL
jgi:hypothetical protein